MDLCWQSNVSTLEHAVWDGHNFSSKEWTSFNFMAAVTICSDFGAPQYSLPLFPHPFAMKWWDQMSWSLLSVCWASSQLFSLSSFTFIKRLFSSSSLSAIRVVSSAYLRLLIFLLALLIPACASSIYSSSILFPFRYYKILSRFPCAVFAVGNSYWTAKVLGKS